METFDRDLRSIQAARELARKGKIAANQLANYSEEQIDRILRAMVEAAEKHAYALAEMAVDETGFGVVSDKLYKNHMASGLLYEQIKDKRTIGVIEVDEHKQMLAIAEPVGLVMGIVPSTNPTSTIFFKALIALKARNAIVFSPHPAALKCSSAAVKVLNQAAVEAGAPANVIQGLEICSLEATNELMHAEEVALIIATGGPAMVKAAYSAGKPALGVGAGNSPAYIERSANVAEAVASIMASKTFDNGTICASEQSIIVETVNRDAVMAEFAKQGGYFMSKEETDKVCGLLFRGGHAMNPKFVGRSAQVIADAAGIHIPSGTRVLIGEQEGVGPEWPLSYEKLTSVLGFYTVSDWKEACELSIELLQNGIGHTMSLHTEDKEIVRKFSVKPASRILINTGSTMGGTGLSTGLDISLTLGCGTWGGSSTSENVGPEHLINVKRVVYGLKDVSRLKQEDVLYQKYHGTGGCCAASHESHQSEAPLAHAQGASCIASTNGAENLAYSCSQEKQSYSSDAQSKAHEPVLSMPAYNESAVEPRLTSPSSSAPDYSGSGISYSLGCHSCSGTRAVADESEPINLEQLQTMIDDMVKALRGED